MPQQDEVLQVDSGFVAPSGRVIQLKAGMTRQMVQDLIAKDAQGPPGLIPGPPQGVNVNQGPVDAGAVLHGAGMVAGDAMQIGGGFLPAPLDVGVPMLGGALKGALEPTFGVEPSWKSAALGAGLQGGLGFGAPKVAESFARSGLNVAAKTGLRGQVLNKTVQEWIDAFMKEFKRTEGTGSIAPGDIDKLAATKARVGSDLAAYESSLPQKIPIADRLTAAQRAAGTRHTLEQPETEIQALKDREWESALQHLGDVTGTPSATLRQPAPGQAASTVLGPNGLPMTPAVPAQTQASRDAELLGMMKREGRPVRETAEFGRTERARGSQVFTPKNQSRYTNIESSGTGDPAALEIGQSTLDSVDNALPAGQRNFRQDIIDRYADLKKMESFNAQMDPENIRSKALRAGFGYGTGRAAEGVLGMPKGTGNISALVAAVLSPHNIAKAGFGASHVANTAPLLERVYEALHDFPSDQGESQLTPEQQRQQIEQLLMASR